MRTGAASDDQMRVLRAEPGSVGEAELERGETEGVERHRVWSAPEPHLPRCGVDVVDGERSQLAGGRTVQEREEPDERLMRVAISGHPSSEQPGLVCSGESAAAEPAGGSVREASGRVGEAYPLFAGEAEEVAQRRQSEAAIATRGKERLDVTARARRPIAHAVVVEVRGELGEDSEALLDRVIGERVLADPAGALATHQQPREVSLGGGRSGGGQRSIRRARRP